MGDVLEVARHVQQGVGPLVGCTCTDQLPLVPMDDLKTKYYIRFKVADRSGVLAAMAGVFAKHNVSVYSVVQRGKKEGGLVDLAYVPRTRRERRASVPFWKRSPSWTTCCATSLRSSAWRTSATVWLRHKASSSTATARGRTPTARMA